MCAIAVACSIGQRKQSAVYLLVELRDLMLCAVLERHGGSPKLEVAVVVMSQFVKGAVELYCCLEVRNKGSASYEVIVPVRFFARATSSLWQS